MSIWIRRVNSAESWLEDDWEIAALCCGSHSGEQQLLLCAGDFYRISIRKVEHQQPPWQRTDSHYSNPLAIAYYYGSGEQQLLLCEGDFYGKVDHQQPPWQRADSCSSVQIRLFAGQSSSWRRRSDDIRQYAVSEAVDRIVNLPPAFPFMAK